MFKSLFLISVLNLVMVSGAYSASYKDIDNLIASNKLMKALGAINKGLSSKKNDTGLLVRKSRVTALQGDQAKDEGVKIQKYEAAEAIASQIIEKDSQSAKGYLRRAVAKGKLILFKGVLESRTLVLAARKDAKKALESSTATNYDKALASYLLGRVHLKLAKKPRVMRIPLGLGWASKKKGGEFLKAAATLGPDSIPFNLDYALYLKDNGDKAKAKELLKKVGTLKVYDPADPGHKKRAKQILSEL